jgi:hypothetical protein
MRINLARNGAAMLAAGLLASCGGGGGSAGNPDGPPIGPQPPAATQYLALTEVANISDAVFLTAPAGDARQFIVERDGRIHVLENGTLRTTPFLDISARVNMAGEGGLLSLAFDPQYASNGYFYVVYTDATQHITVERFNVGASPNVADPTSSLALLRIPHPDYTNHYGGMLAFGPDGMLYLSTGDGGGAGDPRRNAQNANSLLGKLLRIDVRNASAAQPYRIPANNPFASSGGRGEVWALGLRNPWRFSFDSNQLYIADVGQAQREEVNISNSATGGLNYGWNILEGTACYNAATCSAAGMTPPVYEYEHGANNVNGCSITGGDVYRGSRMPSLAGSYFFSDFCAGYLKSLRHGSGGAPAVTAWPVAKVGNVVSFGKDGSGELYLIGASGRVYRIDPSATPTG